jgi:hypothetical protein
VRKWWRWGRWERRCGWWQQWSERAWLGFFLRKWHCRGDGNGDANGGRPTADRDFFGKNREKG